jgi:hypothetical protein
MRKWAIIISVLIVIAGGIYYYLRYSKLKDFEPMIKEKLSKLVSDGSNGLYHLDIDILETDVIGAKITLVNAHLRPDTAVFAQLEKQQKAPNDLFDVFVSQLSIDDVVAADFMANREINFRRLFINDPVVKVWHKKQLNNKPDANDSSQTIYSLIKNDINRINVDTIILQNIDFIFTNKDKKNKQTRLTDVKLFFAGILIDSTTQYDQQRFLYAEKSLISLKEYSLNTDDGLYRFGMKELEVNTQSNEMSLKGLKFQPLVSTASFYARLKHQQDKFDVDIGDIRLGRVNWWALLAEESFSAGHAAINNGRIKVYNDKSQPVDLRSKVGKYPHQLLMKLPFQISVDTIRLKNLDISYTELNPKSGETGTLIFNNIGGSITNVTNDADKVRKNSYCRIQAHGSFMNQAPLTATFLLDLANYKTGNFKVNASLGAIGADALNKITIPLGMLKLNSLNVKSMDVSMTGNDRSASGTVKLIYDDLKITALKSSGDQLKKRGLLSFFANTFVIKKANPHKNDKVRIESATYERNPNRSFFNLVWKTIFTGAGKTVGYNK